MNNHLLPSNVSAGTGWTWSLAFSSGRVQNWWWWGCIVYQDPGICLICFFADSSKVFEHHQHITRWGICCLLCPIIKQAVSLHEYVSAWKNRNNSLHGISFVSQTINGDWCILTTLNHPVLQTNTSYIIDLLGWLFVYVIFLVGRRGRTSTNKPFKVPLLRWIKMHQTW